MNTYETIFICSAELPQEKIDTTVEKVKNVLTRSNGKITSAELWGRRRLAYPIKGHRDGFYIYIVFSGLSEITSVLNQHYRVTDTILRGLTVKIDPRRLEKMSTTTKTTSEATAGVVTSAAPATQTEPTVKE